MTELAWIDAEGGYSLALDGSKLVCRNAKGKQLASVPKKFKQGEAAEQLLALRDWLVDHERECTETVEGWMLRSLPAPREVLVSVWDDPGWRRPLENAVVVPIVDDELVMDEAGFFRGADVKRGIGVVDLDGETRWLDTASVLLPHPILLEELDDYRELATELSLTQGVSQLFRETFARPVPAPDGTNIEEFADGHFEQLNHVLGQCRTLGYRVRGGYACCSVFEEGRSTEARYWIGAEYPDAETYTGQLLWVDEHEKTLPLAEVATVAFSEGMRMARAIYAARKVPEQEGDQ